MNDSAPRGARTAEVSNVSTPEGPLIYNPSTILMALVSVFGGSYVAYTGAVIAVVDEIREYDDSDLSLVASALFLGMGVGSAASSWISGRFGRVWSLRLVGLAGMAGSLLCGLTESVPLIACGRALAGVASGMATALCLLYVGEMCPETLRGKIGCLFIASNAGGSVLVAVLGWQNTSLPFPDARASYLLALGGVPALGLFLVTFGLPESPRWLLGWKQRHHVGVQDTIEQAVTGEDSHLLDHGPALWQPYVVSSLLMMAVQLTGVNAINTFSPKLAKDMDIPPFVALLFLQVWQLIFSTLTTFIWDKYPRRTLVFLSIGVVTFADLLPALYRTFDLPQFVGASGVVFFYVGFSLGLAQNGVVLTEIFPTHMRDTGCAVANTFGSVLAFGLTFLFPIVSRALGNAAMFFFFSAMGVISFGALWWVLPETHHIPTQITTATSVVAGRHRERSLSYHLRATVDHNLRDSFSWWEDFHNSEDRPRVPHRVMRRTQSGSTLWTQMGFKRGGGLTPPPAPPGSIPRARTVPNLSPIVSSYSALSPRDDPDLLIGTSLPGRYVSSSDSTPVSAALGGPSYGRTLE